MNFNRQKSKNQHNSCATVKNTKVRISEVNAEDPVPIVAGEGNRNFDDPVTPVNDLPNRQNRSKFPQKN